MSSSAPSGTQNCDIGGSVASSTSLNALVRFSNLAVFYPTVLCSYACNYTIAVVQDASSAADAGTSQYKRIELATGVPQHGASPSGASKPMYFNFAPNLPGGVRPGVTFLLTPTSGSAVLLINSQQHTNVQFPDSNTPSTYQYKTPSGLEGGVSSLVLDGSTSPYWPANNNEFRIAVIADASATFTLSASVKCVACLIFFV